MGNREVGVAEAETDWLTCCLALGVTMGVDGDEYGMGWGRCMRLGVGLPKEDIGVSGARIDIPVLLGDSGEAIIGAGIVCRLEIDGEETGS